MKKIIVLFFYLLSIGIWAQVPSNDVCSNALAVALPSSGSICLNSSNLNATSDNSTNTCDTGAAGNEVWFTFIATNANNTVTITPNGSTPMTSAVVTLITSGCSAGTYDVCNSATGSASVSSTLGLTPGTQVWVSVESNGTNGDFQICIESTPPDASPGNTCSAATKICDKSNISVPNLTGFTASGVQPACFTAAVRKDVWIQFTVGVTGTLEFLGNPISTDEYDWALYNVTSGCLGTLVSCNYNYATGGPFSCGTPGANFGMLANATGEVCPGEFNAPVTVTAGQTYALLIDNFSQTNNGFDLQWGGTFQMGTSAAFTVTPQSSCVVPLTVNITNTSVGATSYLWNFGDGTTSTSPNPGTHTYTSNGDYLISLVVTGNGCTSVLSRRVNLNTGPVISVTPPSAIICPGDPLLLNGAVTLGTPYNDRQFSSAVNTAIPNNNAAGLVVNQNSTGMLNTTLTAGMIQSICFTINHSSHDDIGRGPTPTAVQITVNGNTYNFTPLPLPSASGTATYCFPQSVLNAIAAAGGASNTTWTLKVADNRGGGGGTGSLISWEVTLRDFNSITGYSWSPVTNMINSTTLAPTVSPIVNTTYVLTATDLFGCSSSFSVPITMNPGTIPVTGFSYTTPVCNDNANLSPILVPGFTTGGTFSSTPVGLTLDSTTGGITVSSSLPNTYTITYNVPASGCSSAGSSNFVLTINPTPAIPAITTTAPTCVANGTSTISNYNAANTYTFTPAGPTAGAGGVISGMVVGTSYTVTATSGTCTSVASVSFSNAAQLTVPSQPTISTTAPTCSSDGISTITNYSGALTYTFTPAGPTAGAGGLISGMVVGTSYTVTASNGSCSSVASTSFSNLAMLVTPAIPTITTTAPTCVANGTSTISNYNAANTYTFTPAGPTAGAGGVISGMVVGTSYTVTSGNGTCTSVASASFSNAAQLTVPSQPTISTTAPTCSSDGISTITNYSGALTYAFTPAGPTAGAGGLISGMVVGTSYTVTASNGSCSSLASASFSNLAMLVTPAIPTITTTAPTCVANGTSTISNYNAANTYTFTPAGPTAGAGGVISGMVVGTSYTVTSGNGTCTSVASASFSNAAQLTVPSQPTISTTAPTCSSDGISTITNYSGALTYAFTPAGPTAGAGGLISGMVVGTSYTVTASNGSCSSLASASFSNLAMLVTPAIPTITTTAPTCVANGTSTISNYNAANTYTFTPAGPTAGAGGVISGMVVGTSYTVTSGNGSCTSVASASFSNAAQLTVPSQPTISTTALTCSSDGISTITNYSGALTYTFTPAGPTAGAGGLISGMVVGASYTVTASNGSCSSVASTSFSNLAMLVTPAIPTITTTAPTCVANGTSTISNYNAANTYTFTPAGPTAGAGGVISGMVVGTSYTVTSGNGSCTSVASASFSNAAQLTVPSQPTILTTAPTCSSDGISTITNYSGVLAYTFTPAGPTAGAGGLISGMVVGTSYTVTASNGSCSSVPSASFSNAVMLASPAIPTVTLVQPTCAVSSGTITITSPSNSLLPSNLFISEVTDEDSGSLTYIELFNGTGTSINLNNYKIKVYNNGNSFVSPNCDIIPTGVLANNSTYVIAIGTTVNQGGVIPNLTVAPCAGINTNDNIRLTSNTDVLIDLWGRTDGIDFTPSNLEGYTYRRLSSVVKPSISWNVSDWTAIDPQDYTNVGNYSNSVANYEYSIDGIIYQTNPVFTGVASGTYTVIVRDIITGCTSSVSVTINPLAATLPTPLISTTVPTCSTTATSTITNYNAVNTYIFTPAGPTVGAGGVISGMVVGTSYTVASSNGSCSSVASVSFSNAGMLATPVVPTIITTAPTCSSDGVSTISNYNVGNTYTFTPSGPTAGAGGLISGMTIGTSYTVTAGNGNCTSIASASFTNLAILVSPAVPTVITTAPACSLAGTSTITNYNGALTYTFTPAGPTVGAGGAIGGMIVGTSYTVTATNGSCTSIASASFTNLAILPVPSQPTISTTLPTCSSDGISTITNYDGSLTYTFTPAGPTAGAGGLISGMTVGTSYTVTASNGSCSSVASASFSNAAMLNTPAIATASVTVQPTCPIPTGTIVVTAPIGATLEYSIDGGATYQSSTTFSGLAPNTSYTIIVRDLSSGCTSSSSSLLSIDSVPSSPIVSTVSGCNGASFEITASVDSGMATYEWYDSSSNLIGTTATIAITESGTYEVIATVNSCTTTEFVTVDKSPCVIPKGVSPNNDGLNDAWDLSGLNAKKVQIFNRYGVEVYSKSDYINEWGGKSDSGNELPDGTYYYVISLPGGVVKTGWVYINREN